MSSWPAGSRFLGRRDTRSDDRSCARARRSRRVWIVADTRPALNRSGGHLKCKV